MEQLLQGSPSLPCGSSDFNQLKRELNDHFSKDRETLKNGSLHREKSVDVQARTACPPRVAQRPRSMSTGGDASPSKDPSLSPSQRRAPAPLRAGACPLEKSRLSVVADTLDARCMKRSATMTAPGGSSGPRRSLELPERGGSLSLNGALADDVSSPGGWTRAPSGTAVPVSTMKVGEVQGGVVRISVPPMSLRVADLMTIVEVYVDMAAFARGFGTGKITPAVFRRYMTAIKKNGSETAPSPTGAGAPNEVLTTRRRQRAREALQTMDVDMYRRLDKQDRSHVTVEDMISLFFPRLPKSDLTMLARLAHPERPQPPLKEGDVARILSDFEHVVRILKAESGGEMPQCYAILPRLKEALQALCERDFLTWAVTEVGHVGPREVLERERLQQALQCAMDEFREGKAPAELVMACQSAEMGSPTSSNGVSPSQGLSAAAMAVLKRGGDPVALLNKYRGRQLAGKPLSTREAIDAQRKAMEEERRESLRAAEQEAGLHLGRQRGVSEFGAV
ncbi:unnamed protein product [Pedinophyceae sp. YPF-701]|nr:unnamed protein product [Pedinophyceae sp. YPF-701]